MDRSVSKYCDKYIYIYIQSYSFEKEEAKRRSLEVSSNFLPIAVVKHIEPKTFEKGSKCPVNPNHGIADENRLILWNSPCR